MQKLHHRVLHEIFDFAFQFVRRIDMNNLLPLNILWIEKTHFTSNGIINVQNCHVWDTANLIAIHKSLCIVIMGYTCYYIVWFLWSHSWITTTRMSEGSCLYARWCNTHIRKEIKTLISAHFANGRVVSRSFPNVWSLHSLDLNPCSSGYKDS